MKAPLTLSLIALLGAASFSASQDSAPVGGAYDPSVMLPAPTGTPAPWLALLGGVDEIRLQKAVHSLCEFGPRMGGTESGDKAAAWLKKSFEEAGLATQVHADPETWCHSEESWSLSYTTSSAPDKPVQLMRAWPYGFSPSASGQVDLSLDVVEGAATLAGRMPRSRRNSPTPAIGIVDGNVTLDGEYARVNHLRSGNSNKYPVFGINKPEGDELRRLLAAGETITLDYALKATIQEAQPLTVVASIPAREGAPKGFLLYCAHGDSDAGGPGADDNASGAAVVLEIARSWSAAIKAGTIEAPPRELRFAVWGKEIHSTSYYMKGLDPETDGPLLGVINYDQAGYGSGADQLNIEPDDLPANKQMIHTILGVLAEFEGKAGLPAHWATNKSLGGTDSYVFSRSKLFKEGKRPSLTLFTSAWDKPDVQKRTDGMPGESWNDGDEVNVDYDNYYHSAGDTPENTTDKEPWNMGWCARVGLIGGLAWLDMMDLPDTPDSGNE